MHQLHSSLPQWLSSTQYRTLCTARHSTELSVFHQNSSTQYRYLSVSYQKSRHPNVFFISTCKALVAEWTEYALAQWHPQLVTVIQQFYIILIHIYSKWDFPWQCLHSNNNKCITNALNPSVIHMCSSKWKVHNLICIKIYIALSVPHFLLQAHTCTCVCPHTHTHTHTHTVFLPITSLSLSPPT